MMSILGNSAIESDGRQPTLDFLRGIAILGVVVFHAAAVLDPGIPIARSIFALGFQGVQLFFLISALTMCYMWHQRLGEKQAAIKFYIRRFFRIAPPFWVAMGGYLLLYGLHPTSWAPDGIGFKQIVTNLFFLSGFWPDTINSVVPGGWSIIDEMMFYAFFPILIWAFRSRAILYVIAAFLLYITNLIVILPIYGALLKDYGHPTLVRTFEFYEFLNQAPIFLLGIFIFMSGKSSDTRRDVILGGIIFLFWLALAFVLKIFFAVPSEPVFWLCNGGLMLIVTIAFKFELTWKPINRLGQLSYSIYLIHFAVIDAVAWFLLQTSASTHGPLSFLIGFTGTLALCWLLGVLLQRTLERAASRLGKSLIEILFVQNNRYPTGRETTIAIKGVDSGS
jgi:exopolysaccharide production protein ExoZ